MSNIFADIPQELNEEHLEDLLKGGGFRLERIVSRGQATPDGEWLVQNESEWVILLKGSAGLTMAGKDEMTLNPGDHINIPAGTRHRVDWTDSAGETVWLAIHYK